MEFSSEGDFSIFFPSHPFVLFVPKYWNVLIIFVLSRNNKKRDQQYSTEIGKKTTSNIDLWCIIYSGAVSSCLNVFIPLWCIEQKGPVFVTIFNPLITVIVAIAAYFLVGEKLYTGCILGGVIIIIGLYSLLWGKEGDQHCLKNQKQSFPTCDVQKKPKGPCFKFIRNRDPLTNHIPYLQWNYGIVSKNTYQTNGKIEVKLVTKVFNSL